jgi:hypothetical protein
MKKRAASRARSPGSAARVPRRAGRGLDPITSVELDELILTLSRISAPRS